MSHIIVYILKQKLKDQIKDQIKGSNDEIIVAK